MPHSNNRLNPLGEADRDRIKSIRERARNLREFIGELSEVGIAATEGLQTCNDCEQFCTAVEEAFLPPEE